MLIKLLSIYLFIAILFLSFLFVYSFVRGKSSHARAMGLLSLCLQVYLLGYLLEINSNQLSEMIFWNQVQYFGIPFFPALWLIISLLYTGRIDYVKGYKSLIIFIIPLITFFIRLTNDFHFLYYKSIEIETIGGFTAMYLTKGPWYLVQMIYVLITLILCTYFYYQRYRHSIGNEKIQFSLLFYASVLPYLALILVFVNWGGTGIDYTAIILPPCIFLINLALTKYNFLDIKNLAREKVFEDSSLGFILLNRTRRVVDFNDQSIQLFKLINVQLKETNLEKLLKDHLDILECIQNSSHEIVHRMIDGQDKYVSIYVKEMKNNEEVIGQLVTLEDVTEKEILRYRLLEMANTDSLSGLNNRRKFRESAEEVIHRAKRYDQVVSLLMMDIDFFKRINDAYGHAAGDEVIKVFSDLLRQNFRTSDIIGRMGGEEFAVVLINCDKNLAFEKAEQFRINVESYPIIVDDQTIQVNVSIGVSELNDTTVTLDSLINQADHALYQAKEFGRNRTVVF